MSYKIEIIVSSLDGFNHLSELVNFTHITRTKHTMTLTLILLMTLDGDVAMDMQRSVKKATVPFDLQIGTCTITLAFSNSI
jgi:hypothetical protein